MKKRSAKLRQMGLAVVGLTALLSGSAFANMQVQTDGGLRVYNSADSAYWFSVGGRLDFDETIFSGSYLDKGPFFPTGANIRRAYLKFMGGVGDCITFNFTPSFSGNLVDFEDAWANWSGLENTNFRLGQFTPLYTLDGSGNWGTINDTLFLESSLPTIAFSIPQKGLGLWADSTFCDMFMLAATVYQPRQNPTVIANSLESPNNYFNPTRSDRLGSALRLTFSPIHREDCVLHLGVLGRYQSMNHRGIGRAPVFQVTKYYPNIFPTGLFSTIPEALARQTASLVNTGPIRARSYNVVAGEAMGIWGPFMLEGEYYHSNVQRLSVITDVNSRGNLRFKGWHAQASYILTGETRGYDFATGSIQNPSPASTCGAWEIAVRYSYIDLNDRNVRGGTEHNFTVGLNWFINDNVRLALNYIRANIRASNPIRFVPATAIPSVVPAKRELDIVGIRLGVMF